MIRPYHLKKGQNPYWIRRVRQIVCPVIPGTPKSVVGPLDILPRCSVGTLVLALAANIVGTVDLALVTSANITAIAALPQTRDRVMLEQVQWAFKASRVASRVASDGARNHNHDLCTAVTLCREIS